LKAWLKVHEIRVYLGLRVFAADNLFVIWQGTPSTFSKLNCPFLRLIAGRSQLLLSLDLNQHVFKPSSSCQARH
jgi:hypothetical protein